MVMVYNVLTRRRFELKENLINDILLPSTLKTIFRLAMQIVTIVFKDVVTSVFLRLRTRLPTRYRGYTICLF